MVIATKESIRIGEATYARDKEGNVMNDVSGKPIVMKNGAKAGMSG